MKKIVLIATLIAALCCLEGCKSPCNCGYALNDLPASIEVNS
ncbi:MAG TPA: hypothetical protein PK641_05820 [Candidatus Enterocola sp.]|nr:hypothetical protein [Candidatus Enterocola sp.]